MELEGKPLVQGENRTNAERAQHCKLEAFGQILALVIALIVIILAVVILNKNYHFAVLNLLLAAIVSAAVSILLIFWGFSTSSALNRITDLYAGPQRPFLTLVSLILSVAFGVTYAIYAIIGNFFHRWLVDALVAQQGNNLTAAQIAENNDWFNAVFTWFIILCVINAFLFLYSAFATYIIIPGEATLRRLFAVSNALLGIFSGLIFYLAYVCYDYLQVNTLINIADPFTIDVIWWVALAGIILSLVGILVNLRRSKILYFILGGFLVLCFFLAQTYVPNNLRVERQAYATTFPNCTFTMQYIKRDFMESQLKCPNKYLKDSSARYSTQCPKTDLAWVYEDDLDNSERQKKFQTACLNSKCCGVITNALLDPFAKLGVWGLFWVASIFATLTFSFWIGTRTGIISPNAERTVELGAAAVQVLLILLFLALTLARSSNQIALNPLYHRRPDPSKGNNLNVRLLQVVTNTTIPANVNPPHNDKVEQDPPTLIPQLTRNFPCYSLNLKRIQGSLSEKTGNAGYRIWIRKILKNSKFWLPDNYKNPKIRLIEGANRVYIGPQQDGDGPPGRDSSLLVEGTKQDLINFFKYDLRYCVTPNLILATKPNAGRSTSGAAARPNPKESLTLYYEDVNDLDDSSKFTSARGKQGTNAISEKTTYLEVADISVELDDPDLKGEFTQGTIPVYSVLKTVYYDRDNYAVQLPVGHSTEEKWECKAIHYPLGYPYNHFDKTDAPPAAESTGTTTTTTPQAEDYSQNLPRTERVMPDVGIFKGEVKLEVPVLKNGKPYLRRFVFGCQLLNTGSIQAKTTDPAFTEVQRTIYGWTESIIGGFPRVRFVDLGNIIMRTYNYVPMSVVPLSQSRILKSARVQRTKKHPRHVRQAAGVTPKQTYDFAGPYLYYNARLLLKSIDATNGNDLTNVTVKIFPDVANKRHKGVDLSYTVPQYNLWDEQISFINASINNLNASVNVSIPAGFNRIIGWRSANSSAIHDYYTYNSTENFLYFSKTPKYIPYVINLVPKVQRSNQIRVLLEWGSQALDLDLFVTFTLDDKTTCLVSGVFRQCAGATFHRENYNGTEYGGELITLDPFGPYKYLFFVRAFKGQNTDATPRVTLGTEPYFNNKDKKITDSFARVSVYVNNTNSSVFNFPVPGVNTNSAPNGVPKDDRSRVDETRLTWLAFCLDGRIGVRSIVPVQKFWKLPEDASIQAPVASLCDDEIYRNNKLPYDMPL
eukprot:TRINITY_DN10474_c0_g2_i1.p1 TRINITY_DN10474_c0_g2~~TRINITY_DN10474_c0_g2_i1.p1  ORF type:complete len:1223 (+),score=412.01 TRINITY_DN10474_c0_g2_i1:48-3716(+)